jgi:hypothetical protein
MGGNARTLTETLYQTVTIPADANVATLSVALHIDTAEIAATANDVFRVQIANSAGATLATLVTYSNLDSTGTATQRYQVRTLDVSAFRDHAVRVVFTETENASLQTPFSLDNVSLTRD